MRRLFLLLMMFCTLPAWADNLDDLFTTAGWPEQRAHFVDALTAAQERYRNNLPPAVYQALVNNSNQRFAPDAMIGTSNEVSARRVRLSFDAPAMLVILPLRQLPAVLRSLSLPSPARGK